MRLWGRAAHAWRALTAACGLNEVRCVSCNAPFRPLTADPAQWLCPLCAPKLAPPSIPRCSRCGHPLAAPQNAVCGHCLVTPPPWHALTFYGFYQGMLKDFLLRFKFQKDFSLLPLLAHLLTDASASLLPCHLIIPMPRHPTRLRTEGFNQVHELARLVAAAHGVPLCAHALTRSRATVPQLELTASQRKNNPAGSFQATNITGQCVLLLDDVMTTGSTLHHATTALLKAGAQEVRIAVIARVRSLHT